MQSDGVVLIGESAVNQAPITGESLPVPKQPIPQPVPSWVPISDWSTRQHINNRLTPYNWIYIQSCTLPSANGVRRIFMPRRCLHCLNPQCVSLCPSGAARQSPQGAAYIDENICFGDGPCQRACPWLIPQRQSGVGPYLSFAPRYKGYGLVFKCDFCHELLAQGQPPACVAACPAGAQSFGIRDKMIARAQEMAEQKKTNEALNVEDALTQSEAFFIKNKKAIIGTVVAVIIIIAGVVMYKNLYADPREEKAQAALFKGQEYFEADAYAQALNGDSIGFAGFVKVADEYSGTKAANLAKAYMGLCYAHLGKYDEAVKALDSFDGDDQMVAPAMKGAMGNCYAQLGQLDKAASMLLKAANEADNNSLSPIYLLQAGEILVKQGKYDDAIQAYTTIKDKYFRSYQAMDIDKYIEQAKLLKK